MTAETRFDGPWAERVPGERSYPVAGFAPGNYWGRCLCCGLLFEGAKRATMCEPCGVAAHEIGEAKTAAMEAEYGPRTKGPHR